MAYSNMGPFLICFGIIYFIPIAKPETIPCDNSDCTCVANNPCTINCIGEDACKGDIQLTCKSGYECTINCNGKAACQDAYLNSNRATSFTVTCQGTDACKGGSGRIDCSTSDCTINCVSGSGVCQSTRIVADNAHSFECDGSCSSSNIPEEFSAAPTMSPTFSPTRSPTNPTLNPTPAPTADPTAAPTPYPTNPSKSPTLYPTKLPTIHPSVSPSSIPTTAPVNMTSDPTNFPIDVSKVDDNGNGDDNNSDSDIQPSSDSSHDKTWVIVLVVLLVFVLCIIVASLEYLMHKRKDPKTVHKSHVFDKVDIESKSKNKDQDHRSMEGNRQDSDNDVICTRSNYNKHMVTENQLEIIDDDEEECDDKIAPLNGFNGKGLPPIFRRNHEQNRNHYQKQVSVSNTSTWGEFGANDMDDEENVPPPPPPPVQMSVDDMDIHIPQNGMDEGEHENDDGKEEHDEEDGNVIVKERNEEIDALPSNYVTPRPPPRRRINGDNNNENQDQENEQEIEQEGPANDDPDNETFITPMGPDDE